MPYICVISNREREHPDDVFISQAGHKYKWAKMRLTTRASMVLSVAIWKGFLLITAFVICLERYFLVPLTWVETILHGGSAIALIWTSKTLNNLGLVIFLILTVYQIIAKRRSPNPKTRNLKLAQPSGLMIDDC